MKFINKAYRDKVINNVLMAVFSVATFSTLLLSITAFANKRVSAWYAVALCISCIGFAVCMVLLMMDRTDLYQSWDMAMA